MKRPVLLAPFFLLLLSLGCSSGERSTETSPTLPAQREWLDEMGSGFDDNDRQTIRELAETYVRAQVLGCTVRGISTMPFTGNLYFVGVDVSCRNERRTAELGARRREARVLIYDEGILNDLSAYIQGDRPKLR